MPRDVESSCLVTCRPGGMRRRRRGQSLVYCILVLFALMSLAALVIDLGFARLAQRQMQSAVDTAALEGLRFRDNLPPNAAAGSDLNEERRKQARRLVQWVFDDDLDPTADLAGLSAGPVIGFGTERATVTAASQEMTTGVYDPFLQLNLNDGDVAGDMVAGTYFLGPDISHYEENDYSRDDFSPGAGDGAFLVRMRRTDESSVDGSRSGGPPVPIVFGRGSVIDRDLLKRGTVVRATAIAYARPAKTVGVAASNLVGAAPFELTTDFWGMNWDPLDDPTNLTPSSDADETIIVQVDSTGLITQVDVPERSGHAVAATSPMMLGDTTADTNVVPSAVQKAYVPLVTAVEDTDSTITKRIVAFGLVTVETEDVDDSGTLEVEIRLRRSTSSIAAENASAILATQQAAATIHWNNVLTEHQSVTLPLLSASSAR